MANGLECSGSPIISERLSVVEPSLSSSSTSMPIVQSNNLVSSVLSTPIKEAKAASLLIPELVAAFDLLNVFIAPPVPKLPYNFLVAVD